MDAAVIGAGPAGLMAAEVLAQGGVRGVTVFDSMPSAGRKFLMAGRGGLNLTHSEPMPAFLARYRDAAGWLEPAISAFPPDRLRAWSEALGQKTFVGSSGRVFPESFKASPLLRALLRRLQLPSVAIRVSSSLDRLGQSRRAQASDARGRTRCGSACNRSGARRRKLAAAWIGWIMGGVAGGQGREHLTAAARELRLHGRMDGCLPRPLRGPAAQGRGILLRCRGDSRRGHRHANRS